MFSKEFLNKLKIREGDFLTQVEKKKFLEMLSKYGKAFVFVPKKFHCVNPNMIVPMVIFYHSTYTFRLENYSNAKGFVF